MQHKPLTAMEMALAAKLLKEASREFACHGCNDYDLPNTQEHVDLLNALEVDNVGPGRKPERVWVYDRTRKDPLPAYDWWLMSYLAQRLAQAAAESSRETSRLIAEDADRYTKEQK